MLVGSSRDAKIHQYFKLTKKKQFFFKKNHEREKRTDGLVVQAGGTEPDEPEAAGLTRSARASR